MPNQLQFDIELTREQIEQIIKDPSVHYIVISGTCTYVGNNSWDSGTSVEIYDNNRKKLTPQFPMSSPCPRPCP